MENEQNLVTRILAGDQESFAELVEVYQRSVYNLTYRMLGDAREAEDAAQEAFLRAYQHLDRYDADRPFKTWLLSIASNYCIDRLRKRRLTWLSRQNSHFGRASRAAMIHCPYCNAFSQIFP